MNNNNPNDIQIFYKSDDGSIREATQIDSKPIKQIVDVMRKVDLKSPEAKKNEVSIKDNKGKRVKLDDQPIRTTYFRGVEPQNTTFKGVEQDKKE